MPFDADTYRANKDRRQAWENLATAREIKARAARGEAYDWELPRIASFVKLARSSMHGYLNWTVIAQCRRRPRKNR